VILSVQNSLYCDPSIATERNSKEKFWCRTREGKDRLLRADEPQAGSNAAALQTQGGEKRASAYVIKRHRTPGSPIGGRRRRSNPGVREHKPAKGEKGITALVVKKARRDQGRKEREKLGSAATACQANLSSGLAQCRLRIAIGDEGKAVPRAAFDADGGRIASPRRPRAFRKAHSKRQPGKYYPGGAWRSGTDSNFQAIRIHACGMATEN